MHVVSGTEHVCGQLPRFQAEDSHPGPIPRLLSFQVQQREGCFWKVPEETWALLFTELVQGLDWSSAQNQSLWPEGTGSALIGWSGSHGVEGCKEKGELKEGGPR